MTKDGSVTDRFLPSGLTGRLSSAVAVVLSEVCFPAEALCTCFVCTPWVFLWCVPGRVKPEQWVNAFEHLVCSGRGCMLLPVLKALPPSPGTLGLWGESTGGAQGLGSALSFPHALHPPCFSLL